MFISCSLAPASSPTNVMVTHNSPTSVSVSWDPPPIQDWNGIIDEYSVELVEETTRTRWHRTAINNATQFLFDFLEESYNYSVRVAAVTVSAGPYSQFHPFITQPDSKCFSSVFPTNVIVHACACTTLAKLRSYYWYHQNMWECASPQFPSMCPAI